MSCTTQQCQLTDTNTHSYTQHSPRHSHSYAHFGLRCEFVLNSMHYAPRQRCNNVATTLRCSFSCQRKMRVIMHRLFVLTPLPPHIFGGHLQVIFSVCGATGACLMQPARPLQVSRLTQTKNNIAETNEIKLGESFPLTAEK